MGADCEVSVKNWEEYVEAQREKKWSQEDMRALYRAAEYESHKDKSKLDPSTLSVDKELPTHVDSVSQLPCAKHSKVDFRVEGCKSTNNPCVVEEPRE